MYYDYSSTVDQKRSMNNDINDDNVTMLMMIIATFDVILSDLPMKELNDCITDLNQKYINNFLSCKLTN